MWQKTVPFFIISVLFLSCGTMRVMYNDSIPFEESAIVQLTPDVEIVSFDNDVVKWKAGLTRGIESQIPYGRHYMSMSLRGVQRGGTVYSGGLFFFSYYFEKGHTYTVYCHKIINSFEIGIGVYDKTTRKKDVVSGNIDIVQAMILNL